IYKDYRTMHVCPRCETTLSQSEVTEGYKDVKDLSVTVKFELVDEPGTYILAWTTTPWTLPNNTALAVGNDINYIKVEIEGTKYILAKILAGKVLKDAKYEVIDQFKGSKLIGVKYKPLFDHYAKKEDLKNRENGWQVYHGDFVNIEEGTGIVHIAPAGGEDDMNLGRQYDLPFVQNVNMDGFFKPEMGELAGLNVKPKEDHMSTDVEIIKYLAHKDLLFHKEKYEHSYPHCWRCDTPLINYATSSWFVNISKIKERMLELAKEINWMPEHIKDGRFGNWLEGARDWSISRQRFWASVIPIWECECGERKVVGSVKELEDLSGEKLDDLHKHIVDKITFKCEKCGEIMKRIPDVFDCWFESGSMPYASIHYPFENKEKFDNAFPAEFIAEGSDQTRAWFYYLHAIATGIKDSHAFKNVIVNGIVLAEDGKKMSKKLKNYPDPNYIMDRYGADPLRYYLLTSPVMMADNLNFSEKGVSESLRKLNNILWNVYKFYEMYADSNPRSSISDLQLNNLNNVLDKWIIARLNQLIKESTEAMEKYNLPKATRPIVEFIDDLSTWYLRRSRDRFKGDDEKDKKDALKTMGHVLLEFSKVLAPFTPFIAEQIYQNVSGLKFTDENKSVHLENWPEAGEIDLELLEKMSLIRKVVEIILSIRDNLKIKVRQKLQDCYVHITDYIKIGLNNEDKYEYSDFSKLLKEEINVAKVHFVVLEDKLPSNDTFVSDSGIFDNIKVRLNTELTPELIAEGISREVIRSVNAMRKENDLTINDRIEISYKADGEIKQAIEKYRSDIMKDTLADALEEGESEINKQIKINDQGVNLSIKKIN
ncbi:isoleucine--tRNA ligase, partial [Candidatus Falkowbacteria bacterium]|nr:isoleucine--tRNA ligase [Candidatus Falkowbacteria bacterium]